MNDAQIVQTAHAIADALEPAAPARPADLAQEVAAERTVAGHRIRVLLEDGSVHVVRVDNRDFVRWDTTAPRQKWGKAGDVPFLFQTFLAWSAGKRAGLPFPSFELFRDSCLEAKDLPRDEDEDTARPTR